jgi:hypothetical protein
MGSSRYTHVAACGERVEGVRSRVLMPSIAYAGTDLGPLLEIS